MYQKGFMTSWLKCIDEATGKEALREEHAGPTNVHEKGKGPYRKDTLDGHLLENHTPKCIENDVKMCRVPSLLSSPRGSPDTPDKHF